MSKRLRHKIDFVDPTGFLKLEVVLSEKIE